MGKETSTKNNTSTMSSSIGLKSGQYQESSGQEANPPKKAPETIEEEIEREEEAGQEGAEIKEENIKNEEKNQNSNNWSWKDINLVFVMPLFCTVATRLPFIYFVIQLDRDYGIEYLHISFFIGAFHFCRVIAISGAMISPKLAHLIGTMAGLAGYLTLFFTSSSGGSLATFAFGNIAVGLAEASAAINVYAKGEYSSDMGKLRTALSYQSAMIGVAVILGFFFGGLAFDFFGVKGVAVSGILALSAELLSLLSYLYTSSDWGWASKIVGDKRCPQNSTNEIDGSSGKPMNNPTRRASVHKSHKDEESGSFWFQSESFSCPGGADNQFHESTNTFKSEQSRYHPYRIMSQIVQTISDGVADATLLNDYSSSKDVRAKRLTYIIALTFSIESVACGYLFTIGPLFMNQQFGTETGSIGIIFSSASLFGTIGTLLAISPQGRKVMKRFVPSPYNYYILVGIIAASVLAATIPLFPVHVISIVFLVGASELFLTLISELQGAITTSRYYCYLGPSAQMVRRLMNVVMAITGPIAYSVFPRLPYLMAGSVCVFYTFIFVYMLERQRKRNTDELLQTVSQHSVDLLDTTDLEESPKLDLEASRHQIKRMSFATQEISARMAETSRHSSAMSSYNLSDSDSDSVGSFASDEEDDDSTPKPQTSQHTMVSFCRGSAGSDSVGSFGCQDETNTDPITTQSPKSLMSSSAEDDNESTTNSECTEHA